MIEYSVPVIRVRFDKNVIIPRFALYVFMSEHFHRTQINKFLNSSSMKNLSMENIRSSRWDRYLGMTAPMTQVPVPTATNENGTINTLNNSQYTYAEP